jgi:hypothetical protein
MPPIPSPASIPMARKITRIGMPRREEKELNKILQVTKTEPRINRLMTAPASKVDVLLTGVKVL